VAVAVRLAGVFITGGVVSAQLIVTEGDPVALVIETFSAAGEA
jgi:hypothetical protein